MNVSMQLPSFLKKIDDCMLYPRFTASIRTGSREGNTLSGEKSISLACSVSLIKALLMAAAFLLALRCIFMMMRMKWEQKVKRKYKNKIKKRRKK